MSPLVYVRGKVKVTEDVYTVIVGPATVIGDNLTFYVIAMCMHEKTFLS